MNKDVIYIEPEDDITDILTGIKNSKNKIVALVPPKKANVLKSAVNFKLLARTAKDSNKAVVLVTTDSALLKLAAIAKIPVAKNLQTKPEIIENTATADDESADSDVIDGEEAAAIVKDGKKVSAATEESAIESVNLDEDTVESPDDEKDGKKSKKKKNKSSKVPNFEKYRKFIIAGAGAFVLIVGFLVWALAFAPAAKILVTVKTTSRAFSENVSFTKEESKEDAAGGLFLLEEHKVEKTSSVNFTATGQVDKGTKATGTITVARTGKSSQNELTVAKGTKFTIGGKVFVSDAAVTLRGTESANDVVLCANLMEACFKAGAITKEVKVTASEVGTDYNIASTATGWTSSLSSLAVSNATEMAGGTSKLVTVVSAEDVAKAKENLSSVNSSEGRNELTEEFPIGLIAISSSFSLTSADPVSSPAIGEEVPEGTIPKLTAKTTFAMFGVDRVRISDYVESRMKDQIAGEEDQTIYSTGVSDNSEENKAFIESFKETDGKYTAKLKTTVKTGPEVTDEMVLDKALGRKIGEVQSLLKSIKGVSSVSVDTSVFWMSSVPKNINKVTVEITVE